MQVARIPFLGSLHVEARAAIGGIDLGNEPLDRHIDERRIGGCDGAVGKGNLQSFSNQVDGIGRAKPHSCNVKALQDVQHLRDMHTARCRRWRADDSEPAVARPHRLTLYDCILFQVSERQRAALSSNVLRNCCTERAVVQQLRSLIGEALQRSRIVRLHDTMTDRDRLSTWQEKVV